VDSGDLLIAPGPSLSSAQAKEMADLKANLYMKTYDLMGYDAYTPGELDLSFGIQYLHEKSKQAKMPFLAANLMDTWSNQPVFHPYVIKEIQGMNVGIFGLISNKFSLWASPEEKKGFYPADPIEAAKRTVAEFKKRKCKVIICLAHMEEGEQAVLARAVPEIHFIVSGHVRDYHDEPVKIGSVRILKAGSRGEYLGRVDFSLEKKLSFHYQLVPLWSKYADHGQVGKMLSQYKTSVQNFFTAQAKLQGEAPSTPGQRFGYVISPFVGESVCVPCHQPQHESWKKTGHAKAFQTLVRDKRESDHTCLPCHTTGFGEVSGFADALENVQCESCHGAKRGHPDNGEKFPPVSEKQCLVCHNPAKSPNFDYAPYLAKVRCPTPR